MGMFTEICDDCKKCVKWVRTSERLPEPFRSVLVAGGFVYLDGSGQWRTYMERHDNGQCRNLNWTPKYWAPMPHPPE